MVQAERLLSSQRADVNKPDQFGWTPLMIGAAERNQEMVTLLLSRGADASVKDRAGRTAADIARSKAGFEVEALITDWSNTSRWSSSSRHRKSDNAVDWETCDVCDEIYAVNNKKAHQASLVHQMELDKRQDTMDPGFSINQTNKGYQLLRKGGWDGRSGLGEDKNGRLFPVKSVLKTGREGLREGSRKSAKVTHFAAKDGASVSDRRQRKGIGGGGELSGKCTEAIIRASLGELSGKCTEAIIRAS